MNPTSVKFGFEITRYPNKKAKKKLSLTLFMNDQIGLVISIGKRIYKMVYFDNLEDFINRGKEFGLTSEDIAFTSRIFK